MGYKHPAQPRLADRDLPGVAKVFSDAPDPGRTKLGLTHNDVGLCFSFGENIDPWNCPSGPCTDEEKKAKMVRETREINSRGTSEHVDATICWRPRDVTKFPPPGGESAGGKALPDAALASFVGGNEGGREKTGSVMAQEVGHIFGLEPPKFASFRRWRTFKKPRGCRSVRFRFLLAETVPACAQRFHRRRHGYRLASGKGYGPL